MMNLLAGDQGSVSLYETVDGEPKALVEMTLIVTEAEYSFDNEKGAYVQAESATDIRFKTDVAGLRSLCRSLEEYARAAEQLEERASLEPKKK